MTRPLPEILRPNERKVWRGTQPRHTAHDRTANPSARTVTAQPQAHFDPAAEHRDLVALIGSRYNTKRLKELAALAAFYGRKPAATAADLAHFVPLITAAEELRNRMLALQTPTGKRTPQTRYHIPEQVAAHHTDPKNRRPVGLDLAALAHLTEDTAAYLATLKKHKAANLAQLTELTLQQIDGAMTALTQQLHAAPRKRHRVTMPTEPTFTKWRTLQLTAAEYAAVQIAHALGEHNNAAKHATKADDKDKKRGERERRRYEDRPGNEKPDETDELAGWYNLVVAKPPREVAHLGRLGRKRITSDTGKTPNRIANYCGDPLKRIYTRKAKGTRALVIVDCSGSMSLTTDDLDSILKASNGATVIGYSAHDDEEPNTYLLAHNQRRTRTMPDWCGGNGVDGPAASWAIKHYRKHNAPVLWITDGGVTGRGDRHHRDLARQCKRIATRHGICIAPDVATALRDLATIAAGKQPPKRHEILKA